MEDKKNNKCFICKDRFAYDAILCGIPQEEFESWFDGVSDELKFTIQPEIRCCHPLCFRRVKIENTLCTRCRKCKNNNSQGKQKFEPYTDIIYMEEIMYSFLDYCLLKYDDYGQAASFFGVNKYYLYSIRNFDIYPSKTRLSSMVDFIKQQEQIIFTESN
jgi:hypothetical protein